MKILLHTGGNSCQEGGIRNYIFSLGEELEKRGVKTDYLFGEDESGKYNQYLNHIPKKLRLIDPVFNIYFFYRFIRRRQYDIVHSQAQYAYESVAARYLLQFLKKKNYKIVSTLHGLEHPYYQEWKKEAQLRRDRISSKSRLSFLRIIMMLINKWKVNFAHPRADTVISVSSEVGEEAYRYLGLTTSIIPNAVNCHLFHPDNKKINLREIFGFSESDILVLFVGASDWRKGIFYLYEAFKKLDGHFKLLVCGLQNSVFQQLDQKYNNKNIVNLGCVPNKQLREIYASADIFCFPSLYEGFPLVLLEAMASGLACVTTKINGAKQLIEDGENGLLIEKRDVEGLSGALEKLKSHDYRRRLGIAARETTLQYTWSKTADKVLQVYNGVLEV